MTRIPAVRRLRRVGALAVIAVIAAACWPLTTRAAAALPTSDPHLADTNPVQAEGIDLLRNDAAANLKSAREEILGLVAEEKHPTHEWGRLFSEDPDTRAHNFRVGFTVNYALLTANAKPGHEYTAKEVAAISEKALWTLTADLREADPKIHTSESLVLRDAQRYLYGSLGDEWLQQLVAKEYGVPKEIAPYVPGWVIDRGYEYVIKKAELLVNAIEEETNGKNPGWGRIRKDLPHSRPGGEAWYGRGLARFRAMNPDHGTTKKGSPFITTLPPPAPSARSSGPGGVCAKLSLGAILHIERSCI
jgi:hypothetical protein